MVIFHSYVKLPEGTNDIAGISGIVRIAWDSGTTAGGDDWHMLTLFAGPT